MNEKSTGEIAWNIYCATVGGVSFNNTPLPAYLAMDDRQQVAWQKVADCCFIDAQGKAAKYEICTISIGQMEQAINFADPHDKKMPKEKRAEIQVCLQNLPEHKREDGIAAEGLYCWIDELQEEGSILLK